MLPAALVALGLVAGGCVPHPVGPARTYGKYEGKAVTTAEGALSAVETARLVADSASRGNAFGPYVSIVVSEMEGSATRVQGTFDSIQPPDAAADRLSSELDEVLGPAVRHLTDLRVAARRDRLAELGAVAAPLAEDARRLDAFVSDHR
jgi:hypothetical protein